MRWRPGPPRTSSSNGVLSKRALKSFSYPALLFIEGTSFGCSYADPPNRVKPVPEVGRALLRLVERGGREPPSGRQRHSNLTDPPGGIRPSREVTRAAEPLVAVNAALIRVARYVDLPAL